MTRLLPFNALDSLERFGKNYFTAERNIYPNSKQGGWKKESLLSTTLRISSWFTLILAVNYAVQQLGAKRLVLTGFSIGGGVLSNVLPRIKHDATHALFIKTFFDLSALASSMMGSKVKDHLDMLNWNYDPLTAVLETPYPYTVVQKGNAETSVVESDGIIDAQNALATELNKRHQNGKNPNVILASGNHSDALSNEALNEIAFRVHESWKKET